MIDYLERQELSSAQPAQVMLIYLVLIAPSLYPEALLLLEDHSKSADTSKAMSKCSSSCMS